MEGRGGVAHDVEKKYESGSRIEEEEKKTFKHTHEAKKNNRKQKNAKSQLDDLDKPQRKNA